MSIAIPSGRIKQKTRCGFRFQLTEDKDILISVPEKARKRADRILKEGQLVHVEGVIGTDRILANVIQVLYTTAPDAITDFAGYCIVGGEIIAPEKLKPLTF